MRLLILYSISSLVAALGALNWLFIGIFDTNIIHALVGGSTIVERLAYILVGALSLIPLIFYHVNCIMYSSNV